MPVNYAKEYLIFVEAGVVFLPFHVRVKKGRQYSNFEKKISNLRFISFIIHIFRKSLLGCDFQELNLYKYPECWYYYGSPKKHVGTYTTNNRNNMLQLYIYSWEIEMYTIVCIEPSHNNIARKNLFLQHQFTSVLKILYIHKSYTAIFLL